MSYNPITGELITDNSGSSYRGRRVDPLTGLSAMELVSAPNRDLSEDGLSNGRYSPFLAFHVKNNPILGAIQAKTGAFTDVLPPDPTKWSSTVGTTYKDPNDVLSTIRPSSGISAPIEGDIDKIQDDEVESIQNQWQSFLAEYERIYSVANDAQKANWQAAADWNERMYRDQWKMQAEGLREAGINPLMMAGALRASSVPQISAASVVAPSFPSNEFSATANTEIEGLYSLYATLSTLQSEERRAELARILGYAELSQKAADSILRFIGLLIPGRSVH